MHPVTVLILGFAALGRAAQIPREPLAAIRQSRAVQLDRRDLVDGCPSKDNTDVDQTNPASFSQAGAQTYLDAFLKKDNYAVLSNQTSWLTLLDESTSFGGGFTSQLDCTDISSSSCVITTVACQDFTPHEVWWIRSSAVNVRSFFSQAFAAVNVYTLNQSINIDSMVKDFDVGKMDDENPNFISELLKVFSPFGSIFDKSNKLNAGPGVLSDLAGLLGAVVGLAGAAVAMADSGINTPPTAAELAAAAGSQLSKFFTDTVTMIKQTNKQIFMSPRSGETDYLTPFVQSLKKAGGTVDDSLHPIAQIFGTGAFVNHPDGKFAEAFFSAMNETQTQLATVILAAQKVVVYENTIGEQKYCTNKVAYWTGSSCFTLKKIEVNRHNGAITKAEDIPDSIAKNWDKYRLNLPEIYANVKACGNKGTPPDHSASYSGDYPPCAFPLSYMSGKNECPDYPGPKGFEFADCNASCNMASDCATKPHPDQCLLPNAQCKNQAFWEKYLGGTPILPANPGGTNIHVNSGCIVVNDSSRCQGGDAYNVAYQNTDTSNVTIYAMLPSDTTDKTVTPGCQLNAQVPASYGDVFFGADGCLYDSSGNQINGQCCQASTVTTQVTNPYYSG
ncbi:hypothetical protein BGZ63DRAFT_439329 [Mariannaea sp. PMI_226]|nr:hypothetical protein BGZ63DRAFT_439329 [Mariannaea sp. PMI_226]